MRGIEIRHFSCEIARLALIITEYQCNVLYRGQRLALAEFLPLKDDNWITCGNVLRLDWLSICPPTEIDVKVQGEDLDFLACRKKRLRWILRMRGERPTSVTIHLIPAVESKKISKKRT